MQKQSTQQENNDISVYCQQKQAIINQIHLNKIENNSIVSQLKIISKLQDQTQILQMKKQIKIKKEIQNQLNKKLVKSFLASGIQVKKVKEMNEDDYLQYLQNTWDNAGLHLKNSGERDMAFEDFMGSQKYVWWDNKLMKKQILFILCKLTNKQGDYQKYMTIVEKWQKTKFREWNLLKERISKQEIMTKDQSNKYYCILTTIKSEKEEDSENEENEDDLDGDQQDILSAKTKNINFFFNSNEDIMMNNLVDSEEKQISQQLNSPQINQKIQIQEKKRDSGISSTSTDAKGQSQDFDGDESEIINDEVEDNIVKRSSIQMPKHFTCNFFQKQHTKEL